MTSFYNLNEQLVQSIRANLSNFRRTPTVSYSPKGRLPHARFDCGAHFWTVWMTLQRDENASLEKKWVRLHGKIYIFLTLLTIFFFFLSIVHSQDFPSPWPPWKTRKISLLALEVISLKWPKTENLKLKRRYSTAWETGGTNQAVAQFKYLLILEHDLEGKNEREKKKSLPRWVWSTLHWRRRRAD